MYWFLLEQGYIIKILFNAHVLLILTYANIYSIFYIESNIYSLYNKLYQILYQIFQ